MTLLCVDLNSLLARVLTKRYLGTYEVGEFSWISQEEDRCVVSDDVPVALVGPKLDRKSTWITSAIVRARLAADSRESNSNWTSLALLENIR